MRQRQRKARKDGRNREMGRETWAGEAGPSETSLGQRHHDVPLYIPNVQNLSWFWRLPPHFHPLNMRSTQFWAVGEPSEDSCIIPGELTGGPGGPGGPLSPRAPRDPCREKSLACEPCLQRCLPASMRAHTHTHRALGRGMQFSAPSRKCTFSAHILTSLKSAS